MGSETGRSARVLSGAGVFRDSNPDLTRLPADAYGVNGASTRSVSAISGRTGYSILPLKTPDPHPLGPVYRRNNFFSGVRFDK